MYSDELRNAIRKLVDLYNRITFDFNKDKEPEEWHAFLKLEQTYDKAD